jgi:hypothetical protein
LIRAAWVKVLVVTMSSSAAVLSTSWMSRSITVAGPPTTSDAVVSSITVRSAFE